MGTRTRIRAPASHGSRGASCGFILVVVLWMTTLMALMSAAFSKAVQSYVRETAQRTRAAEAELLTDAGLNLAALDLAMVRDGVAKSGRFVTTGGPVGCGAGDKGWLFIRIQDASGRININLASDQLLSALFLGLGVPAEAATRYAARIIDFRDRDDERLLQGAEFSEYKAQGETIGPKNAAFESLEELHQVLGLPADVIAMMLPYVTIYSGVAGLDPKSASPQLLNILEEGFRRLPESGGTGLTAQGLPQSLRMPSQKRFFSAEVTARLPGGTEVTKLADIDVAQGRGSIPTVRAIRRVIETEKRGEVDLAALPQC